MKQPKSAESFNAAAARVLRHAQRRPLPLAALTTAATEAIAAGREHGENSTEGRKAHALHRQWDKLLRRHLHTIAKIRMGGEALVLVESQIMALAAEHGLTPKRRLSNS